MIPSAPKQQYQAYAAATQTVARTKQIVMLYDGVIRLMQQSKEAIKENRIEDRYKALTRASDIIMGLQGCLDFEVGGSVGQILYNFYSSIDGRISSIHRSSSLETCDAVIFDVKQMRDVWDEIDQKSTNNGLADMAQQATEAPKPAAPEAGVTLSA